MIVRDAKRWEQPKPREKDASALGTVRVVCRPGPDAEDRRRRLITLMVKLATKPKDAPS